jgi:hypothetical protein
MSIQMVMLLGRLDLKAFPLSAKSNNELKSAFIIVFQPFKIIIKKNKILQKSLLTFCF